MKVDWTPSPVLHFDFNSENFLDENALTSLIDKSLRRYEALYGRDEADTSIPVRFASLIENAYLKTGRKVVILVDEYDKPLLAIEDKPELFERMPILFP